MSDQKFDPKVTTIVRRFSEKIAEEMPEDLIAQALGTWEEGERARENEGAAWQHWLQFTEQPRSVPFLKRRRRKKEET